MGFWSGIKHALNSTLGTADFKPLDKLVDNILNGLIRFEASDEIYMTIHEQVKVTIASNTLYYNVPKEIKFNRQGSFNLAVSFADSIPSTYTRKFRIHKNNEEMIEYDLPTTSLNILVNVDAGDVIGFSYYFKTGSDAGRTYTINPLYMCATPKLLNNFFETEVV